MGTIVCLALAAATRLCPLEVPLEGYGSRYAINIMEATVELRQTWWPTSTTRGLPPDLSPFAGFVATLSCDDIGKVAIIRVEDQKVWRPYLVSDCAGHQETVDWMRESNILVEFGYRSVVKLGISHGGGIPMQMYLLDREEYLSQVKRGPVPSGPKHLQHSGDYIERENYE